MAAMEHNLSSLQAFAYAESYLSDYFLYDGCRSVTLEEFTTLMMGALSGKDPRETLWSVFTVLSRTGDCDDRGEELITLDKLMAVCKEFKVIVAQKLQLIYVHQILLLFTTFAAHHIRQLMSCCQHCCCCCQ